jgi:NAD(P)-dependent dehydrogenase (short-subunit alcohol dehydrogenase family)
MQDSFSLQKKVAIVTGASKGIGKAIAIALGQHGATVILSSRKQESVDQAAAELREMGIDAHGRACHMGSLEDVKALADFVVAGFGGVDILVNNAATNPSFGPVLDTDAQVFDKIIDVNVNGPLEIS